MPLWARKKDRTHAEVVEAFQRLGWATLETWRAPHCPDLIVARGHRVVLVEVKSGKKPLTDEQRDRFAVWPGETAVVTCVEDVLKLVRAA
jgi:hypothetical protein